MVTKEFLGATVAPGLKEYIRKVQAQYRQPNFSAALERIIEDHRAANEAAQEKEQGNHGNTSVDLVRSASLVGGGTGAGAAHAGGGGA